MNTGASRILNATLVALGSILLLLGLSFRMELVKLRGEEGTSRWARRWLVAGFTLAGSAVTVTGVFDIKAQPSTLVHNVAAFTAPIVLVITLLAARMAIGNLGIGFDALSGTFVTGTVAVFLATVGGHMLPYVLMELICFGLIGAWLWLFDARLRRPSTASARRVHVTATSRTNLRDSGALGAAVESRANSGRYCR